ncbi:MAG TPA: PhzF family phenazine biosynthesis protein [Euzebyales bacterium]|nr:PhzF family phenazine biosynthesis protein [Euzebyales bacterium]
MRIRIIDAFTDQPFAGNPAAVCLLDGDAWPDEAWMQQLAAELHLSETAFARPLTADADADWGLRWFTPAVEVDLCGHATLATVHALRTDGRAVGVVRFRTRSGVVGGQVDESGAITLDFPAASISDAPAPHGLAAALGAVPDSVHTTGALRYLLAVVADEPTVRTLTPDIAALEDVTRATGDYGVIVTARAADPDRGYDFVSRYFAPVDGIPEDPVTGSAHTALAPYWSARLGDDRLTGRQVSARGGTVRTVLRGDRVELVGRAVTVLDGHLQDAAVRGAVPRAVG